MRAVAALGLCLLVAACGSDDDDADGRASAPAGAELTVIVRAQGEDGPAKTRRFECERLGSGSAECRRLRGLTARRLAPVPSDTACAQIYGGPATARVRGTLRGRPVEAEFSRVDACEIERWDRNVALLGRARAVP